MNNTPNPEFAKNPDHRSDLADGVLLRAEILGIIAPRTRDAFKAEAPNAYRLLRAAEAATRFFPNAAEVPIVAKSPEAAAYEAAQLALEGLVVSPDQAFLADARAKVGNSLPDSKAYKAYLDEHPRGSTEPATPQTPPTFQTPEDAFFSAAYEDIPTAPATNPEDTRDNFTLAS